MGLAGLTNDVVVTVSWGACMDLGRRYTGTVSGAMNMMGAGGGAVAGPAVAYLLHASGNDWNLPLYVASVGYFGAMACWFFIDPVSPVVPEESR
jgi:hypothetical protein